MRVMVLVLRVRGNDEGGANGCGDVIYWDDGDSGEAATVHYLLESGKTVLPVVMVMA